MSRAQFLLAVLFVGLATAAATPSDGGESSARSSVDVPTNDPEMQAAFVKAQSTLDDFLAKFSHPPSGTEAYSVKVGLKDGPTPGTFVMSGPRDDKSEFFWIVNIRAHEGFFTGEIGNDPEVLKNVSRGQTISFKRSDIVDWYYLEFGKMRGNYTACPALVHASRELLDQMRVQYGIECR